MLKIKTGQTPNLPWWRLQKMSDEEIKKFNNSFMMIEGLPESVGTEKESVFEKEVWNRAIEAAAKLAETSKGYPTTVSQNILRLKK